MGMRPALACGEAEPEELTAAPLVRDTTGERSSVPDNADRPMRTSQLP